MRILAERSLLLRLNATQSIPCPRFGSSSSLFPSTPSSGGVEEETTGRHLEVTPTRRIVLRVHLCTVQGVRCPISGDSPSN